MTIRVLAAVEAESLVSDRARVLAGSVRGGASVSFMLPFDDADAASWWRQRLALVEAGRLVLLGAFVDDRLECTVQLLLDLPPNQPRRAEVAKLLVDPAQRRLGLARALMQAVELKALRHDRSLLVLDTADDGAADLYRRLGRTEVGAIPGYALLPDGPPVDTTIFNKRLAQNLA